MKSFEPPGVLRGVKMVCVRVCEYTYVCVTVLMQFQFCAHLTVQCMSACVWARHCVCVAQLCWEHTHQ